MGLPTDTTTTKPFWEGVTFNSILSGANNLLKSLFPTGVTNTGTGTYTGGYYPSQQPPANNNTIIYVVLLGVLAFVFLRKK